jgi:NarL family two-component system response regulator YdfI
VIRLAIAAESAVVRAGLETLVASHAGIELAGAYPDLGAIEALRPDVVLAAMSADELSPPGDGYTPAIVLLTNERHPAWTQEAMRLGVRALLARDVSPAEILAAVEAAANGMAVIDPRELETMLAQNAPAPVSSEAHKLTARELEVLRMMAEGEPNKSIAWKLGISDHTVKFHVASILAKLNAGSRTEAVTIGVRKGMILL